LRHIPDSPPNANIIHSKLGDIEMPQDPNKIQDHVELFHQPEYQELYKLAAALMFSENPEIGLAVLMSYDYLAWFYASYSAFLKDEQHWSKDTDEFYKRLVERIETK
jgi:Rad3-related DNA helicase